MTLHEIVTKAIEKNKVDIRIPSKITRNFLKKELVSIGILDYERRNDTNEQLLNRLDSLENRIFVFRKKHRIPGGDANVLRKNIGVGAYQKIDNVEAINFLIEEFNRKQNYRIPEFKGWKLTDDLAKTLRITPHELIKHSHFDINNPKIGIYWVGKDNHFRVMDWMSAIHGARKFYFKEVVETQRKHYAHGVKYIVKSPEHDYIVTLSSMPITKLNDNRQYSLWLNARAKCECDYASFMAEQHEKQANPLDVSCKHANAALLQEVYIVNYRDIEQQRAELRSKGRGHGNILYNEQVYRIMLPLLAKKKCMDIVRKLQNQTLIAREDTVPQPLNDIELNTFIGAYIARDHFNNLFFRMDNPIDFSGYKYFLR